MAHRCEVRMNSAAIEVLLLLTVDTVNDKGTFFHAVSGT